MCDNEFPDYGPQCPQDAVPNPQDAAQETGLHVAKVTDHRDFDIWTNDNGFLQRFLMDKPATWRTAIQRYWCERSSRRELAGELGLNLESTKNLLRRIRKAARDFQSGTITIRPRHEDGVRYPGRPHCGINTRDIEAICDGDEDALAHMKEYGRLNIIERLNMFAPAITGELVKTLQHSDAIGVTQNEAITSGLVAKADALKAKIVKPDPFMDLPVTAIFADQCTRMKIPETENGVTRWKARIIGRSEAEPIERGRPRKPRKEKKPATTPKTSIPQDTNVRFTRCAVYSAYFGWADLLCDWIGFATEGTTGKSATKQRGTSCCTNTSQTHFKPTASPGAP